MHRTRITLVDDLDATEADETVQFALDGAEYEIDLSKTNARRLRETLEEFVRHGRRTRGRRKRPAQARTTHNRVQAAKIRGWARQQGVPLAPVGRIPTAVRRQYEART